MNEPPRHRVARDFDGFRDEKPNFADRDRIEQGPERAAILGYLKAGRSLIRTTWRGPDLFEETRGNVVPSTYRTDGVWMWTDAVAYYLDVHGISPEPDLVAHIKARDYRLSEVGDGEFSRAAEFLREFMEGGEIKHRLS